MPGELASPLLELWSGRELQTVRVDVPSPELRGVAVGSTAVPLTLEAHGAAMLRYRPQP